MKKVGRWFADNWGTVVTSIVSMIALGISIATWYNNEHVKQDYSNNVNEVIISSSKIVTYDLNLLEYKTLMAEEFEGKYDSSELSFQITSLETQLQMVQNVEVTSLPKKDILNYITYRSDLTDSIYMLRSSTNKIKNNKTNTNNHDKTQFEMTPREQSTLLAQIETVKHIIREDTKALKSGKSLYDVQYSENNKYLNQMLKKGRSDK